MRGGGWGWWTPRASCFRQRPASRGSHAFAKLQLCPRRMLSESMEDRSHLAPGGLCARLGGPHLPAQAATLLSAVTPDLVATPRGATGPTHVATQGPTAPPGPAGSRPPCQQSTHSAAPGGQTPHVCAGPLGAALGPGRERGWGPKLHACRQVHTTALKRAHGSGRRASRPGSGGARAAAQLAEPRSGRQRVPQALCLPPPASPRQPEPNPRPQQQPREQPQ